MTAKKSGTIRRCRPDELGEICEIINEAARAYKGIIPEDRWHEPYMPLAELKEEVAAGVSFWGLEHGGKLAGVMGVQSIQDVVLIRHAYVRPEFQSRGIGGDLLRRLRSLAPGPVMVGTWAAATWAIAFYEKHGFRKVIPAEKDRLLKKYWTIPERQIETSVVLADNKWFETAQSEAR
ncbi:MAG: GNAT family N-acetyltransferase [Limisphaerales bacterium]